MLLQLGGRVAENDIKYKNIILPKGTELIMYLSTLLRDDNEFKNANDFIPDRWEKKSIEEQHIVFGWNTKMS